MNYQVGEVWYARFPLEEDASKYIERPVIIADVLLPDIAVIKVTKHNIRSNDSFDTPIIFFKEAGLKLPSTARISKLVIINESQIDNRKGKLHSIDQTVIFDKLNIFLETSC
jgi:hypothetical protein